MKRLITLLFFTLIALSVNAQKNYQIRTLAFYNLENLFDTINNTSKNDEASPMMELKGNRSKVYWDKIDKLGRVLSEIGTKKTHNSPVLIGVVEVENDTVLKDLVKGKFLKKKRYKIVHYESPDKRGIDVALLYQDRYFKPTHTEKFELLIYDNEGERIYTRDQLLVSGLLDGEKIHIIVNHWPSKRGGTRSIPYREKAALLNLKIIKKIRAIEPNAKIITLGDFNDDPVESSFKKIMKTKMKKKNVSAIDIYNPFEDMFRRGFNTAGYRDNLNLFDQILISGTLLTTQKDFSSYKMLSAGIYNPKYMINNKGRYKGYPFRSFSWGKYTGGYSDHFPVFMYLIREKK